MGKIDIGNGWIIKVHGNDHPPFHAHILHPDGKASIDVHASVINSGVPAHVIADACKWVENNSAAIEAEWTKMNNPRIRRSGQ